METYLGRDAGRRVLGGRRLAPSDAQLHLS